jgi:carbon storage regulator
MLVLSRQKDESIMIGDEVEITIVDVRGDKVRLGITAPKSIPVHRREIYDAIQREKAQQASGQLQTGSNNEPADKTGDSTHPRTEKSEKTSQK